MKYNVQLNLNETVIGPVHSEVILSINNYIVGLYIVNNNNFSREKYLCDPCIHSIACDFIKENCYWLIQDGITVQYKEAVQL